ncbi:MAG TPA: class I SAM-dependent methyltransferase, partial [Planctomycetota bacterium]|nr:class I SAM-dependent methyltransferase [Planctomycetota bacterium]
EPFQKYLGRYRRLFDGRRLYSLDRAAARRPSVVGDIFRLPFATASVVGVICASVLEHVPEPGLAADEIGRVLKPGGLAFVYVPFLFPDHAASDYGDYFRFTAGGIRHLYRRFSSIEIEARDDYVGTTLRFVTGFKFESTAIDRCLRPFKPVIDTLAILVKGSAVGRGRQTTGFDVFLTR